MREAAIIVDVDGTIADLTHRLHHVQGGSRNWEAFFGLMHLDEPIQPIIDLANTVFHSGKCKVLHVSGRPDSHRRMTSDWFAKHGVRTHGLYMRKVGDYRQDAIIKLEILAQLIAEGYDIQLAIDDRPQVIAAWRSRGILTLACKPEDADLVAQPTRSPTLHIMVGPSGAGKSTWLTANHHYQYDQVISTDRLRAEFCGDFKDQTRNPEVFKAYHTLIRARLWSGLDVYADATHIRRKDRIAVAELCPPNGKIIYHVFNRSMADKRLTGGWRNDLDFDLIAKHENTFAAQLKDILKGDNLPNVTVIDHRMEVKA